MYTPLLFIHSYLRWVALALLAALLIRSLLGALTKSEWPDNGGMLGRLTLMSVDLQFLAGLLLYMASPLLTVFLSDPGASMRDPQVRFLAVEHQVAMIVAIALLHIGYGRARKRGSGQHLTLLIFLLIALAIMAYAIPWPGTAAGRPLFRVGPQ